MTTKVRLVALGVLVAAVVLTAGTGVATAAPTARQQLDWVLDVSTRLPVSDAEIAARLDPSLLSLAGGATGFNQALAQVAPLRLVRVLADEPTAVQAIVDGPGSKLVVSLETSPTGLIAGLLFSPYLPAPRTWSALGRRLHELAPDVAYAAARIAPGGRCQVVRGEHAEQAQPLGSAFKLYVLGALGHAVLSGRAAWDQPLAIRDDWKSLPSGTLQDEPAGTVLPLSRYADAMISISDNTATDHLMHLLGRPAVERQLRRFGNRHARLSVPFLTTRELFVLKGSDFPVRANRYLALPPRKRARALDRLDAVPLSDVNPWTRPRKLETLEWFASPADICRAYAGLGRQAARPGMSAIGEALSINDGEIALDRSRYPSVWFKGGSEPGVATLTYRVRTSDGRTLVVALLLSDHRRAFRPDAVVDLVALARGAVVLADRATRR